MKRLTTILVVVLGISCLLSLVLMLPIIGRSTEMDTPATITPVTPGTTTPAPETTPPTTTPDETTPNETTPDNTVEIPSNETPTPEPVEPKQTEYILTFVGDCTLGTMPQWMSYSSSFTSVVKQNYGYPFARVLSYFANDDCTFINFEGVLANEGVAEDKEFTFRGPTDYINILTSSSVEIANLSNNHTFDFGQPGYNSTVKLLQENNIQYIERNTGCLYTTKGGLVIGLYGVYFNLDEQDMKNEIQALKDAGADIIVAAAHWGDERVYTQSTKQSNIAHKLIDAGVHIVWGHHPHVLQPIEEYNGGIIYYSLGNFSFGGNHNPSDKDTAIIQQTIIQNEDGTYALGTMKAIPCRVSSVTNKNDFQPAPYEADTKDYNRTMQKLGLGSQEPTEEPLPDDVPTDTSSPEKPAEPTPAPQKTVAELVKDGTYMLKRYDKFYSGSVSRLKITKITFTRTAPATYDESWYANVAATDAIMGYRVGTEVYIVGEHIYANTYSGYMFARLNSLGGEQWASLECVEGLELLNTSYMKQAPCMFYEQLWTEINGISDWDVSKCYDFTMMFADCINVTTLDIGKWDMSNATTISGMFCGHSWAGDMKLTSIDVSKWKTSKVVDMSHVFYGCAQLTTIPLDNWDVSKVTTFSHMFADCYKLENLNLSKWNTKSVVNFDAMFNDCHSFTVFDVSGLDTKTATQFSQMFEACANLTKLVGIETWDVSNASKAAFEQMFHACTSLEEIDLSAWHCTPDDTAWMFRNCKNLKKVNIANVDMSKVTWVEEMFAGCTSLEEVIWKDAYDFSEIKGYDSMFNGCGEIAHTPPLTLPPKPEETEELVA